MKLNVKFIQLTEYQLVFFNKSYKNLDFFNYEIYGDCDGWDHKNKLELRKLKIKKLIG